MYRTGTCIIHEKEYQEIEIELGIDSLYVDYMITGDIYIETDAYLETLCDDKTTKIESKDKFYYYGCGFSFNDQKFMFKISPILSDENIIDHKYSGAVWVWETTRGHYSSNRIIDIPATRQKMIDTLCKNAEKITTENKIVQVPSEPMVATFQKEGSMPCNDIVTPCFVTARELLNIQIEKHNSNLK